MQVMFEILLKQLENWAKNVWRFGLKDVAAADSGRNKDDWESVQNKERFDLGKEDGGGNLIKDIGVNMMMITVMMTAVIIRRAIFQ